MQTIMELTTYLYASINGLHALITDAARRPLDSKTEQKILEFFRHEVDALEVRINDASGSNPGYAERDLPEGVRTQVTEIRHAMRILRALYGPERVQS